MIRTACIALLITLLSLPARAQDAEAIRYFDEGTAALVDGRFQDALRSFTPAEEMGWVSDALYYNMGLAYYRLDELGQAIRYLEKARSLNEDDPRIEHSLAVAGRRQVDRFSTLPDPFWKGAQQWLVRTLPLRSAFVIGLICWLLFAAGWIAKVALHQDGDWHRRARQVTLVLGLLLMTHALASSVWPAFPDRSVVLESQLELREQASQDADSVVEVHEGLIVEVRAEATNWQLIEIPNGTRGWVPTAALGDI